MWFFINSFYELSTERCDHGSIRWSAIQKYAEVHNFPYGLFRVIIRAMDNAFLQHLDKKKNDTSSVPETD